MQKGIGATSSKSSLLYKAIACLLSIILIMSYSSIAYALDEDETTGATATEQQADSSSSTDELVTSEEVVDTEETEETTTEEEQAEEASDSGTTDDAVSLEVPTISALSEVSLFSVQYTYIDANGNTKSSAATVVTSDFSGTWSDTDTNGGWYIVIEDTTISSRITCSGDINLILADGATLTASAGISVNEGNSLTIYAQSTDGTTMGSLIATAAAQSYAGIGGDILTVNGAITINGGNITATGAQYGAGIGGGGLAVNDDSNVSENITINGGVVTATGGRSAAGIGGGSRMGANNIIINGGTVTASATYQSSGIGGGVYGSASNITITGGTVVATGASGSSTGGAGIGSGPYGSASYITISGGTVTATGSYNGAGIGGGRVGSAYNIIITGGEVTANGGYAAAGIGSGSSGSADGITISGGTVTATGGQDATGIGGASYASGYEFDTYVTNITISGGIVTATGDRHAAGIGAGGHYSAVSDSGTIKITGGIITASGYNQAIGNGGSLSQVSSAIQYANGGFYYRTSDSGVFTYQANTDFTATTSYLQIYPAASASFNSDSLTISSGTSLNLNEYLETMLENYTSGSYTWASSDSSVASVDANGTITALSTGTATISLEIPITIEGQTATPLTAEITIVVSADNTGGAASTDTTGGTSASSSSGTSAISTSSTSASADTSDTSSILPQTGDNIAALLPVVAAVALGACAVAVCAAFALRKRHTF